MLKKDDPKYNSRRARKYLQDHDLRRINLTKNTRDKLNEVTQLIEAKSQDECIAFLIYYWQQNNKQ